jgi:phosphoglycolate phosphatase
VARRFDLLVFDWDGTLMDSAAAIAASIQDSCRDLGLPVPDDRRASHVIGLGLKDALEYAVPDLAQQDYGKLVERYRHHFLERDRRLTAFEGVEAMLRKLAGDGFMLAVATGKTRAGLDRALKATGFGPVFHGSRCADECWSKPHPAMLLELMEEFGTAPPRVLMIGDTTHDLQMAANAKVASVGVSYGAHPREQLAELEPLACVDNVPELAAWLYANA